MKIRQLAAVLAGTMLFSATAYAKQPEYKVQLYFSPQIMNDRTGEVVVDIDLKNIDLSIPDSLGDICSLEFEYEYNDEKFDILTDEKGNVEMNIDETTLVSSQDSIDVKAEDNRITVAFKDNENLIAYDGTLCSFTLIAKNVSEIWNSFDYYPIRFVEGSISVVTYNGIENEYTHFEGIDGKVGAYNRPPEFDAISLDKTVSFSSDSMDIQVNGETVTTDAMPFLSEGTWMIPLRHLAENIGMKVEWDGENVIASAYGEYKTLKVSLKDNIIYVNSAVCEQTLGPVEKNGRTFIPISIVSELYPRAEIKTSDTEISIYIP